MNYNLMKDDRRMVFIIPIENYKKKWWQFWKKNNDRETQSRVALSNLLDQHVLSSIKFSVFTYYDYPNNKSTLEPGLIEYSSILNGEIIIRDISDKLLNLKMDKEDLKQYRMPIRFNQYDRISKIDKIRNHRLYE